jgi:hypothetical protein
MTHMILVQLLLILIGSALSLESVVVGDVNLNRVGKTISVNKLDSSGYKNAGYGFTWNSEDNDSTKWRPQGITSFTDTDSRDYVMVSWYGREQENYDNRGVRIALADITNSSASEVKYRHILLVDEHHNTFVNMHGGGLAFSPADQSLHVPDSRSGTKKVYTFPLDAIMYVPESERDQYYTYEYVWVRATSYDVPITPSFLSFDWDANQFLVGTFWQCSSSHVDSADCMASDKNRLSWYSAGAVDANTPSCAPFYSELQGAAAATVSGSRVLWTSSSYGSSHTSHLHVSDITALDCASSGSTWDNKAFRTIEYPPGLEDLHVTSPSTAGEQFLWSLTEFGTHDGSGNSRTVFMTDVLNLLP